MELSHYKLDCNNMQPKLLIAFSLSAVKTINVPPHVVVNGKNNVFGIMVCHQIGNFDVCGKNISTVA